LEEAEGRRGERPPQQQENTFSIAEGSIIFNPDAYSYSNLRQRKHYSTAGGITRKIPSVEDKFRDRQKSDAERIMDAESDKMVNESYGSIKITSRVESGTVPGHT
jgi:hypothetical protein